MDNPAKKKMVKKFKLGDKQMKNLQKAFGDEKITKAEVISSIKEAKSINILPYTEHSKLTISYPF